MLIVKKILLIMAAMSPLVWYFPNVWRDLGWRAWYLLGFIIAIRPLADLLPNVMFLRKLAFLRKELGILCGALALAHGAGFYLANDLPVVSSFFDWEYWTFDDNQGYAHVAGILAIVLFVTSNKWSQIILKRNWKRIQYLSYVFFWAAGTHIFLIGGEHSEFVKWQMLITVVLWILAYLKKRLWKK